ncbi:MAG: type II toxin-antitoxin system PemK/MazF family toxin [Lachnospiraceae bacterium]|nr:type II toxin-antitoxin system PemK/MazF family toxin [Lachnospiraceae bacterium]
MKEFCQGDIINIGEYGKQLFVIISKNAFIKATGVFHVCPLYNQVAPGPIHIKVCGNKKTKGTVICEQIKLIDPNVRICKKTDYLKYDDIANVSDALQGIFEYD